MAVVDYNAPQSVQEAVTLLSGSDIKTKVMAGGTDLIIQSKSQTIEPLRVVDLKHIAEMMSYSLDGAGLSLGPCMCCAEFTALHDVEALYPGLVEAAYLIGSTQVQGRASIGGNLCNSSPAADTIPALIAIGAKCRIVGAGGERSVAVEDFVTGVGRNCMQSGELLQRILVARPAPGSRDAYLRFIPRTEMDIAVAGAGVSVTLDSQGVCTAARVAIGAVAQTALLVASAADALIGTQLDDTSVAKAAAAASAAASPITDRRGTIEFRRHIVGVLVKRATLIAKERAQASL
ncbi:xanthine dehydrogenase family protein subunit M [Pseudomonadales bacterium]|nr:xanthine dehydrogenase family protein subunit M [Pseudomonadales bacterium]MDC1308458.1 xanthine dehydrogenase family protein subunit M [Pseudomonadales bacterium]